MCRRGEEVAVSPSLTSYWLMGAGLVTSLNLESGDDPARKADDRWGTNKADGLAEAVRGLRSRCPNPSRELGSLVRASQMEAL